MPYSVPIGMKLCRHDPAPGSIGTAGGSTAKCHVRFRENETSSGTLWLCKTLLYFLRHGIISAIP